jgi:hypothetical protein
MLKHNMENIERKAKKSQQTTAEFYWEQWGPEVG